ncbi:MAG TPA: hypothetical protein VG406_19665 [Isosphaeraceae bacterium]|jgi:hypothetical protein|nr:hypothetical protein [Isosphaeraceae bacterium]
MMKRFFSTSPSYLQSIQGLHRLHSLAPEGRDESPEADEVRDGLEHAWRMLSEVEKKRITGLSEDLDSLGGPPRHARPMEPEANRGLVEADEARQAGEWDCALELLRRWGEYVEPVTLSRLRGDIWQEAGDPDTAAIFLGHAEDLARDDDGVTVPDGGTAMPLR